MIHGIDVSSFQPGISWNEVKASGKVSFAYAKATEGLTFVDDQFALNLTRAQAVGIPIGAYHFFRFAESPTQQAQHFINNAQLKTCKLLPMVDVEVDDGVGDLTTKISRLATFNQTVERAIGKRIIIYSSYSFWNDNMAGTPDFSGHPFWIAEYNSDTAPTLPNGFTDWVIWQFSDGGYVPGVPGTVDLDVLNGPLSAICR